MEILSAYKPTLLIGADEKLERTIAARRNRRLETPGAEGRIRVRRRSAALALLGLFLVAPRAQARAGQDNPSEYQLKAAFVYNFAKFVDWPPNAYSNPQSPFAICILGEDPFGSSIDDALRGKTVADHPVVIRRDKEASAARRCQIVFVSASERHRLAEILGALKGANTLIVGDFDGFAAAGGAIELTLQDSRIRFAINPTAADGAGLRISSRLLALATIVHGPSGSEKN